ncbi:hypothetical protein [Nitrososphaera sp.]|uniref:hypothetical protein n=1 Tax=Nitrososphaera sp. TaxID=1971748 RepID=UPI00307D54A0
MESATGMDCTHCGHPLSMHFSNDARGLGSRDASQVHKGCSYVDGRGMPCPCPGFRHGSVQR